MHINSLALYTSVAHNTQGRIFSFIQWLIESVEGTILPTLMLTQTMTTQGVLNNFLYPLRKLDCKPCEGRDSVFKYLFILCPLILNHTALVHLTCLINVYSTRNYKTYPPLSFSSSKDIRNTLQLLAHLVHSKTLKEPCIRSYFLSIYLNGRKL